MKILHLNVLPRSPSLALLVLRVWFGGSLLALHGWGKLTNFADRMDGFPDPLGVGSTASLVLVVFAEFVCAGLIVLGLYTRVAAVVCGISMAVAFTSAHGMKLSGPGSGELVFLFLAAFVTLFIGGAGRYSIDARIGAKV